MGLFGRRFVSVMIKQGVEKMLGVDEYYLNQLDRLTGADDTYDQAAEYLENNLEEYAVQVAEYYADPAYDETAWEVRFCWAMHNTERAFELLSVKDIDRLVQWVVDEHFSGSDDYYED